MSSHHRIRDDGASLAALQVFLSSSSVCTCSLLSLRAAHAPRRRSAAPCRSALAAARLLESVPQVRPVHRIWGIRRDSGGVVPSGRDLPQQGPQEIKGGGRTWTKNRAGPLAHSYAEGHVNHGAAEESRMQDGPGCASGCHKGQPGCSKFTREESTECLQCSSSLETDRHLHH